MRKMIGKCPACDGSDLEVTRLRCKSCGTAVEGRFSLSKLGNLSDEHQEFIETFIRCRGIIKDVERELGVSYPTVRGRLDRAIRALGFGTEHGTKRRKEILESLEKKEISPEEAVRALKESSDE